MAVSISNVATTSAGQTASGNVATSITVCPVCFEGQCRGGGNLRCRKRNPRASHCYGILDTYGGIRFVVTHKPLIKNHVRHDELCIMVPNLVVHEPIAWGDIPGCIRRIEQAVNEWIETHRPNEPHAIEAIAMYRLRRLEQQQESFDPSRIVET